MTFPGSPATGRAYGGRTAARAAVVRDAIAPFLDGEARTVLDIGGGTGGYAVQIAAQGHRVTVVDPSPDALAALARRAREAGVEVAGHQGELSTLPEVVAAESVDLVLCHGVLELVDDPGAAMATLHDVLRPGGRLSLLAAQRHAGVIARAMAGHFAEAKALLDDAASAGRSGRRFTADELLALVAGVGLEPEAVHGVRVFADLVPGSLLDAEPGAAAALAELEQAVADRSEYLPLAAQVHVLASR